MHDDQSWMDIAKYFGFRCPTCDEVGFTEVCFRCKHFPWQKSVVASRDDAFVAWLKTTAGKEAPRGNKRQAFKDATSSEPTRAFKATSASTPAIYEFRADALCAVRSHQSWIGLPSEVDTKNKSL